MLYLFTWNSEYLIQKQVSTWKNAFKSKHWEENITHIHQLNPNSKSTIWDILLSRSLFTEKRLVLISGFPYSADVKFSWASELEEQIIDILPHIPEEVLVVFYSVSADKRKKWWKQLIKNAETKQFDINSNDEVVSILSQIYKWKIEMQALNRIVFLKWANIQKCISEIEKLLIWSASHISQTDRWDYTIISEDVDNYITAEYEESIFVFIDTLTQRNWKKIFSELENLLQHSNIYAVYQSIIANMRIFLYIELLKSQRKSPKEISDMLKLWNRSFLIQKNHSSSIKSLSKLYTWLLNFDKNMKFWKFVSSEEKDLKRELENIFLKFLD